MNISPMNMAVPTAVVKSNNELGMKLLAKSLDTSEMMGQGLVNMIDSAAMERSVNPAVGSNFDLSV